MLTRRAGNKIISLDAAAGQSSMASSSSNSITQKEALRAPRRLSEFSLQPSIAYLVCVFFCSITIASLWCSCFSNVRPHLLFALLKPSPPLSQLLPALLMPASFHFIPHASTMRCRSRTHFREGLTSKRIKEDGVFLSEQQHTLPIALISSRTRCLSFPVYYKLK